MCKLKSTVLNLLKISLTQNLHICLTKRRNISSKSETSEVSVTLTICAKNSAPGQRSKTITSNSVPG